VGEVVAAVVPQVERVLVVDDGSSDGTAKRAEAAGAEVLSLRPNRGKGAALRVGIERALALGADVVVTLDADGEHDPRDVARFLAALEDADVVLGARRAFRSGARRVLNEFALFWFQLIDPTIQDTICGYRAFRSTALPRLNASGQGFSYEHEVLLLALAQQLRIKTIEIGTNPRAFSHVSRAELVRVSNHFTFWVLRHLGSLRMSPARKALLAAGCATGLAVGLPAGALLRHRR
jgi:glycosyltransferase involved in cell wall biosynthesis